MSVRRTVFLALVLATMLGYLVGDRRKAAESEEPSPWPVASIVDCLGREVTRVLLVTARGGRLDARRVGDGWTVEPAEAGTWQAEAALEDVVEALCTLPVIERIDHAPAGKVFGLDPPRAQVTLLADGRETRVAIGELSPARNFLYVSTSEEEGVLKVGALLGAEIDRLGLALNARRPTDAPR